MGRPFVFLDVDGVLSPLVGDPGGWRDWAAVEASPFHLVLSRQMGRRLAALDADIVWLTTWEHDANAVVAAELGWDRNEVLERPASAGGPWWKLDAIRDRVAADPRPFVWIEDELAHRHQLVERWLDQLDVPHLLVSPEPTSGLTEAELARVERFVADHGSDASR